MNRAEVCDGRADWEQALEGRECEEAVLLTQVARHDDEGAVDNEEDED